MGIVVIQTRKLLAKLSQKSTLAAITVFLAVILAGYLIGASRASSFFAAIEAESGALASNATKISDSSASGGKAIQFNAPAPSGGGGTPPSSGFPDATNTGIPVGTVLTRQNTSYYIISTPGTVIDGWDFVGQVEIRANNVTIKNSRIRCEPDVCIHSLLGVTGMRLSHNDVGPDSGYGGQGVISESNGPVTNNTIDSLNIHNVSDGIFVDGGVTITNNYIHNLDMTGGGAHSDDIQTQGGPAGANVLIQHNTLEGGNTSNIIVQGGGSSGWVIDNNQMLGRSAANGEITSWSIGFDSGSCPGGGCRFTNNHLNRTWQDGPSYTPTLWTSANWYGNVYIDNGATVLVP